jgi:hypothetical protein
MLMCAAVYRTKDLVEPRSQGKVEAALGGKKGSGTGVLSISEIAVRLAFRRR